MDSSSATVKAAAAAPGPATLHASSSSTYIPGFSCFSPPVLSSSSTTDFDFSSTAPSVIRTRRASLIPVLSSPSPGPSPSPTSLSPVSPVSPMAHLAVSPPYHYSFHQYHPNSSTGSAGFTGTSPYPSSNLSAIKVARRCASTTSLVKSPSSSASASSLATLIAPNSANHQPFLHPSPTAPTTRSASNTALVGPSEEPSVIVSTATAKVDSQSKQPVSSSSSSTSTSTPSSSSSSSTSSSIPQSRPHHLLMSHSSTSSLAGRHSTLDPAVVGTAPNATSTTSTLGGHSDSRLTRHHSFLRSRISSSLKRTNISSVTLATNLGTSATNSTSSLALLSSTKQTPMQATSFATRGENKRQLRAPTTATATPLKTSPKASPRTSPKPPTDRHSSSSSSTRSSDRSSGSSSTYTSSSSTGKNMPVSSTSSSSASAPSQKSSHVQPASSSTTATTTSSSSAASNPDQNAFDLSSFQESTSGYPFLRALHSFDASTLFSGQSDDDPSSICLSFQESEIVLLHSIHPSGWGDATILSNAARGWIPTNYFTPYSDPKIVPVLSAVLNFVLAPKSHPLPRPSSKQSQNQSLDSPQEPRYTFPPAAISAIVAGVRSLLEACGTLTRDTPIVRRSQSIRKFRKILLAELAILVSLAKQYKYTTDDANIERLVTGSYKIIFRAVIFLDIWTLDRGSSTSTTSSEQNSENVTPTSTNATKTETSKDERPTGAASATESHSPGVTLSTSKPDSTTKPESQKRTESLKAPAPSIDNLRSTLEDSKHNTTIESIKEVDIPTDSHAVPRSADPREPSAAPSPVPVIIPPRRSLVPNRESVIFHDVPPSALQRLEEVHDALTSYLGNFLNQRLNLDMLSGASLTLDANSSACTQILVNTRKSMLACRELLAAVESISSHSLPRNKDLEKRKDRLFSQIRQLVSVARDVVASTPATAEAQEDEEDEDEPTPTSSEVPDEISPRRKARAAKLAYAVESRRLVETAAICARTSDECVAMCRLIIDRIGDFQLSPTREYPDFSDGLVAETPTELEHKTEATSMPTTAIAASAKTSEPVNSTLDSTAKSFSSLSLAHRHTPSTTSTITDAVPAPQTSTSTAVSSASVPSTSAMSSKATLFPSTTDSKMSPMLPDIPTILPLLSDQFDDPPMHSPDSGAFPYPQQSTQDHHNSNNNVNANANANANTNANTNTSNNTNSLSHAPITPVAGPSTSFSANTTAPLPTDPGSSSPVSRQSNHLQQSPQTSIIPAAIINESDARVRAAIAALPADERVLREVGTARIRGASLPALVKVLTDDTTPEDPDAHLLSTFFLTFRQFTTPLDLVNTLITRFQNPPKNSNDPDEDLHTQIRQAKVYNILKRWMESYWKQSTDAPALPRILTFANTSLFNSVGGYYSPYALSKSVLTDLAAKIPHLPDGEPLVPRPIAVPGADEARRSALTYSTTPLIPVHLSRHQIALLAKAVDAQESIASPSSVKEVTSDDGRVGSVTANAWNRMVRASSSETGSDSVTSATATASGASGTSSLSHSEPYGATAHTIVLFLDIDAAELAKQITLLDSGLLCLIRPEELLDQNFSLKRRSLGLAPNVSAMTLLTNQLSFFVGDTILNPDISSKTRQRVLKHWIKTAEKCHELSSFNALMTIVSALQSVNVVRLRKTWAGIAPRHANALATLKSLLSMDKNYSAYRAALRAAPIPRVPYLGLYLTDLTFVGEGNHPLRSLTVDLTTHEVVPAVAARRAPQAMGTQSQGTGPVQPAPPPSFAVINFDRYDRITRIIGDLQCQQVPYRVAPCSELQAWLRMEMARSYAVVSKDHNGLWRRSMIIEPKQ